MLSKKTFGITLLCIVGITTIILWKASVPSKTILKIFHAGSLAVPFERIEESFEHRHPDVDVQREHMGSVMAVKQITDVGRKADVLAVADYTLIHDMLYVEHADWHVRFARNEVVLAYNLKKSKYANEINSTNWYNILRKEDVTFGFSDPNADPCGYRALMIIQLAELYYNDSTIFDDLVLTNTAITVSKEDATYLIKTPEDLKPNTEKVVIRPKSVELISFVESGGIDYAFEYRSVAVQHNLEFLSLPEKINLGKAEHTDFYERVKLEKADGKVCVGKPVVYGMTVPKNAPNPKLGLEFVKYVLSKEGRTVLNNCGQPSIVPAVGNGNLPEELKTLVEFETGTQFIPSLADAKALSFSFMGMAAVPHYRKWEG